MKHFAHSIGIVLAFSALGIAAGAQAGDCRDSKSVVKSATSLAANKDAGGHVAIHVAGNPTEVGKSQFQTEKDFTSSFTKWREDVKKLPTPKTCGANTSGVMDCVKADVVGITTAIVCDAVDPKTKLCTKQSTITPVRVAFRYANSKETGSVWILNTAYPSRNDSCS